MKELEDRILKDGVILPGEILKVGSFLNQQVDTCLLKKMAKEVRNLFPEEITKVLTIEASGLPFATAIAMEIGCPMVFAKKQATLNLSGDIVESSVYSYTHKKLNHIVITRDYISSSDKVLIADDFLANGNALRGLIDIVNKCGAQVVGCAVQIEKYYQNGGNELRNLGYKVESLACIAEMKDEKIKFKN